MLNGVTLSGIVRFRAMVCGTPTWSMAMYGSGVITARAVKSTRFPIKFPLTRPSLLFSLCFIDFNGRPGFNVACGEKKKYLLVSFTRQLYIPHTVHIVECNNHSFLPVANQEFHCLSMLQHDTGAFLYFPQLCELHPH